MNKEEIRKEYFKLKNKGHSNNQCRKIIYSLYGFETTVRTLRRWTARLYQNDWDLRDSSKRPKTIYYKITPEIQEKIISIKKQTGWGAEKIEDVIHVGHTTINKILKKNNLTHTNPERKKRIKYIRWQRKHPLMNKKMDIAILFL
jgi:hypothetical protein